MRGAWACVGQSIADGVPLGTGAVDALRWTPTVRVFSPLREKERPHSTCTHPKRAHSAHTHDRARCATRHVRCHVHMCSLWPCVGMCMHGAVAQCVALQHKHVRTCTTLHTQGTFSLASTFHRPPPSGSRTHPCTSSVERGRCAPLDADGTRLFPLREKVWPTLHMHTPAESPQCTHARPCTLRDTTRTLSRARV